MGNSHTKQNRLRVYAIILSVVAALLLAVSISQTSMANELRQQTQNTYMSAFSDLCDYLDDIDVCIKKAILSSSPKHIASVSSQIYMQAASAKMCLSQLPLSDVSLDNTSKFLVQAGDYAASLATKTAGGETLTEKEYKNLSQLSDYAEKMSEELEKTREKIYSKKITFTNAKKEIAHAEDSNESFSGNFSALENEFIEYPALIYDGPFSDHIINGESAFLKFQGHVTDDMAKRAAIEIIGNERAGNLELEGESGGAIESYIFKNETEDRSLSVAITKQGKHLLWMLDNRAVESEKISVEEAQQLAKDFLKKAGYENMKESYFDKSSNVATLNFAYTEGDVVIYPDLVKVKVALDDGEILGIEAGGYLMNHKKREFPETIISKEEASLRAGEHLDIESISLAVIPLPSGRESFCYELKGQFDEKNFLIYINAETGEDERILMLEESSNGILTV